MDTFLKALETEIQTQKNLIHKNKAFLRDAPSGSLFMRKRKGVTSFYQIQKIKDASGWHNKSRSIRHNPNLIHSLAQKKLAKETLQVCRENLPILEAVLSSYQSPYSLTETLSEKYQSALALSEEEQLKKWNSAPYKKAPFEPKQHIHETLCGELVRSKSEVIIANALFSYGIPFHFEEQFPYPSDNGDFFFPDFTIPLPKTGCIIWEHLGMLDVMSYAVHNGKKLHVYQTHDFLIGKNLILTQDDSQGNCSSTFIYQIIERDLLPHFKASSRSTLKTDSTPKHQRRR